MGQAEPRLAQSGHEILADTGRDSLALATLGRTAAHPAERKAMCRISPPGKGEPNTLFLHCHIALIGS